MKNILLFCSAIALASGLASPAFAAPYTYGPENCEFQVTFPEKPFIEKKCGQTANDCTEVATYTKAVGADSSTNFRVSCNPLAASEIQKYTPAIIEETLKQLVKSNNLTPYNSQSSDADGYKSASSIALSERDGKPLIYNGQIWIGKKSMFTVEAEMVGSTNSEVEKTFVGIMKNMYPKDRPPKVEKSK
ncbi:MAG: hypothetical protein A3B66_08255 [Alphaproteobacteria bacterium RIFCSPHIGHO2_02_FULL_46_13]|nr:MAG: hypothetical protein A3B66_08255 [Alphaproteobacteria bacterium RIFCSPHIGHO2_02_FULL_46_13]